MIASQLQSQEAHLELEMAKVDKALERVEALHEVPILQPGQSVQALQVPLTAMQDATVVQRNVPQAQLWSEQTLQSATPSAWSQAMQPVAPQVLIGQAMQPSAQLAWNQAQQATS